MSVMKGERYTLNQEIKYFFYFGGDSMEKMIITVNDLSLYLGVSTDSIYTMVRENQIPYIRLRRRILFHREIIERWLREGRNQHH